MRGVLGITGGIGAGKSVFARMLRELRGWPLLEADKMGHEALQPGSSVLPAVLERFGEGILDPAGSVDRKRLGSIVFSSASDLADLNQIVHPFILEKLRDRVAALREGGWTDIILVDAALLLDWLDHFRPHWIVLVRSPRRLRLRRLEGRGLSRSETEQRLASQRPMETIPQADWTVDNEGGLSRLRAEARRLAEWLDTEWFADAAGGSPEG